MPQTREEVEERGRRLPAADQGGPAPETTEEQLQTTPSRRKSPDTRAHKWQTHTHSPAQTPEGRQPGTDSSLGKQPAQSLSTPHAGQKLPPAVSSQGTVSSSTSRGGEGNPNKKDPHTGKRRGERACGLSQKGPEQRGSKMRRSGPQPAVPEGGQETGNAIKQLEKGPQDEGVATPRSKQSICHPAQHN